MLILRNYLHITKSTEANNCPSGMTCADNVCEKCANMDDEYCIPFEVTEGPPDKFANSTNKVTRNVLISLLCIYIELYFH